MTAEFADNRNCFVCGEKNPHGLRAAIRRDAERGESEFEVVFPDYLQGWSGVVHGGMLATVLDEALVYAAAAKGLLTVTGEITIRYLKPAPTGVPIRVKGRFLEDRGRVVLAESEATGPDGQALARASGKLVKPKNAPVRNF